ncbi:MAG: hypothetical protein JWM43_1777 [Acidobacteriaceae bacterium]|nr:hypothetical protein [Acidobacteriaceae bacterium]
MSTTLVPIALPSRRALRAFALTVAFAPVATCLASAQSFVPTLPQVASVSQKPAYTPVSEAMLSLPDSPGVVTAGSFSSSVDAANDSPLPFGPATGLEAAYFQNVPPNSSPIAGRFDKYIKPGQQAPRLHVSDKIGLGIKDAVSPLSFIGWAAAAEYSQLVNGSPNYGTNGKAFLQRFGAASARASSQGIFTDSIMASVLHEDPRYYKMGRGNNVFKRIVYAGTRPLITRTDGGHTTINLAYLSGNLAGAALTQAYYPPVNTGISQVMQTFGGSIGGGAIGFLSAEFLDDILQSMHLQKRK